MRLFGPFLLTAERIDSHLQANSPGVYGLGEKHDGNFVFKSVGRSDQDVRAALKQHVAGPYSWFKFCYALSPRDALEKECELYHSLVTLDNPAHPAAPKNSGFRCPYCLAES